MDGDGVVFVSGYADDAVADYPTTLGAFDTSPSGTDAFVTALDPTGASLAYSTLLGGDGSIGAHGSRWTIPAGRWSRAPPSMLPSNLDKLYLAVTTALDNIVEAAGLQGLRERLPMKILASELLINRSKSIQSSIVNR